MSDTNQAILAYIPSPDWGNAHEFLDNLAANPTDRPLIKFSHAEWENTIRLKGTPEILMGKTDSQGKHKPFAISNIIFFTALRIAISNGITHFIYLEPDCRVGRPGWDAVMYKEFFSKKDLAVAGSVRVDNPCVTNLETTNRWRKMIRASRGILPILSYGNKGCTETGHAIVWTNGALSIYSVAELVSIFTKEELDNTAGLAMASREWDLEIGIRLCRKYLSDIFYKTHHMSCIWSTCGNVLSTEAERLKMLADGEVVAIHQVKKGKK